MPMVTITEGDLGVIAVPDGGFVIAALAPDGEGNLGVSYGDVYIYPRPYLYLMIQRECLKPGSGVMIGRHYASTEMAYEALGICLTPGALHK
jgi:hypothetical protein